MFKWLKRQGSVPPSSKARARSPSSGRPAAAPDPAASLTPSLPLPEVVSEGNTHADWSAWEDSMTALDSQMPDLEPAQRIRARDTGSSELDDLDPFSGVRGKRS